ncbi:MAG: VWA domain-containing protein [Myxococcales bacterium]|nr:VWA domain-containing protein [Myxococcales bacterium]
MARLLTVSLAALALVAGCARAVRPSPVDPELVELSADLGHVRLLADQPGEVLARLRIGAREAQLGERPPLNLALVVDTSGSMEGEAIADAREATKAILQMLRPDDRVSVTVFHSRTEVLLESTEMGEVELAAVLAKVDAMEARGTTDMAGGLQHALAQLSAHRDGRRLDRIVLLGDGVPNDPTPIVPLAQSAASIRVPITAIGLGLEYDELLMGQLAQLTGGRFSHVEEPEHVVALFRDEVVRMDRTVARHATLQLQPGPGVEVLEVLGQDTPGGTGGLTLQLGELSMGEQKEIVVRLSTPARRVGATIEVLDAMLVFHDAVADAGVLRRSAYLGLRTTANAAEVEESQNAQVHERAGDLVAARATVAAIQMFRAGDVAQATLMLDAAEEAAPGRSEARRRLRRQMSAPAAAEAAPAPAVERTIRESYDESLNVMGY